MTYGFQQVCRPGRKGQISSGQGGGKQCPDREGIRGTTKKQAQSLEWAEGRRYQVKRRPRSKCGESVTSSATAMHRKAWGGTGVKGGRTGNGRESLMDGVVKAA